jgi:hypothetical protein
MSGFSRMEDPARQLIDYYRIAAQINVEYKMIARWILPSASEAPAK